MIDESVFRASFRAVVRGVFIIIVLSLFKSLTEHIPGAETAFGKLRFSDYLDILLTLGVVAILVRIFVPLKQVIAFYLSMLMKVGKIPGRDMLLGRIIALSQLLVLFVYLVVLYQYLMPVILQLNNAFLDWDKLKMILDIGSVLFGVYILVMLWREGDPVIEVITGGITDKVAGSSVKAAYRDCAKCGARNDLDAEFCTGCGTSMNQSAGGSGIASCPRCSATSPAGARFCQKCGMALQAVGP
ncbi:MAG: zinc ribbon domain-containing protein [Acetobacteraceae bacterium]